jgi:hypothetical protein
VRMTSSDPTFVFLCGNFMISFNLIHIFATSMLYSESISATGFCTRFITFSNQSASSVKFDLLALSRYTAFS